MTSRAVGMTMVALSVTAWVAAAQQTPAPKPAPASKAPAAARAGNIENGKVLYTKYGCYQCHGRAAQGGPGPKLGPQPLPLEGFIFYSRQPAGDMPPYTAKVVTDQEFADIHAYLESLPPPATAAAKALMGGQEE